MAHDPQWDPCTYIIRQFSRCCFTSRFNPVNRRATRAGATPPVRLDPEPTVQCTGQPPRSSEPFGVQKIISLELTQYLCRSLPHPCWHKMQPGQKCHFHPPNQPINQASSPVQVAAYVDPQWTIIRLSYSMYGTITNQRPKLAERSTYL